MGDKSSIEWTNSTWNPIRGCSRVSPGCDNCYAMGIAYRFSGPGKPFEGLAQLRKGKPDWTGKVRLVPEMLSVPLRWRKPRRVFVNSMSDLFHPALSNEDIAAVFGVMAACPQHTFQILTKRPERAREWFEWIGNAGWAERRCHSEAARYEPRGLVTPLDNTWPLPNVWLGASVENQEAADKRIPELLQCQAAVRFLSCEPLLGPVDLLSVQWPAKHRVDTLRGGTWDYPSIPGFLQHSDMATLDWVIVGSESGNGARPMRIEWARGIVDKCVGAGVACFVKQIANEHDRKGGNPEHWPTGHWPREFPQ